jgi:hypothetical protein
MYSLLMNIHDVMALNTDLVVATHLGVLDCSADGIVDSGRDEKGEEARVEVSPTSREAIMDVYVYGDALKVSKCGVFSHHVMLHHMYS